MKNYDGIGVPMDKFHDKMEKRITYELTRFMERSSMICTRICLAIKNMNN